jgi:uncharacterized protein (DUF302 family)
MSANTPVSSEIVTVASRRSVQETLEHLQQTVRAKSLQIFAVIDHSGEAERTGLKMQDAKLLIFESPKAGTPFMIASLLLALDLLLKALVWRNNEGRVWISYNSVSYLAKLYNLPSDLTKNIAGIEGLIEAASSE